MWVNFVFLFMDVGEACWWTVHPASKQRSEGEKVRVGDDLILVSVATERYLVSNFFIQGLHYVVLCKLFVSTKVALASLLNPLPVQFKALLHGQKGCVFFSGHLNLRTAPETGFPSREKNHNN